MKVRCERGSFGSSVIVLSGSLLWAFSACTGKVAPQGGVPKGESTNTGGGDPTSVTSGAGGASTTGSAGGAGTIGGGSPTSTTDGGGASTTTGEATVGTSGVSEANSTSSGAEPCGTLEARAIFQSSCAASVCHDQSQPAAGLDLSGADPAGQLVGVPSALCPDETRVVAGDPEASYLWAKLTESMPACGEPMPVGTSLSAEEITCIQEWIVGLGSGVVDCETCGGTACIDLTNDANHCGACDKSCATGQVCTEGACVGCPEGESACGTDCVDLTSDMNHCGACGEVCSTGESCVAGMCVCAADESVSFASDIAPLLDDSCGGAACHGGRMPKQGLDLTAGASYDSLVGVPADQCSDDRLRVDPGAPADSYLMHKLTGANLCFGSLMPKTGGALDAATLDTIAAWICSGAPNN